MKNWIVLLNFNFEKSWWIFPAPDGFNERQVKIMFQTFYLNKYSIGIYLSELEIKELTGDAELVHSEYYGD